MLSERKPMSVTVIGCVFITVAVLMMVSGIMDMVSFDQLGSIKMASAATGIQETPVFFKTVLDFYQQYFFLVTLTQVIFSGFMLFSGYYFLKLHSWARTSLEGIAWLGLVYIVIAEVFYVISWIGFVSGPAVDGVSRVAVSGMLVGVVLGTAVWGFLLGLIVKYLRGETIRSAVEPVKEPVKLSYN